MNWFCGMCQNKYLWCSNLNVDHIILFGSMLQYFLHVNVQHIYLETSMDLY